MPAAGLLHRRRQLGQLRSASHEPAEPARGSQLEPRADGTRADQLVDRHRSREPLDGDDAEGLHGDVALGETEGMLGQEDLAGRRELLHAPRQVGRLSDGGVVHAQVAADRADHDLAGVQPHANLH